MEELLTEPGVWAAASQVAEGGETQSSAFCSEGILEGGGNIFVIAILVEAFAESHRAESLVTLQTYVRGVWSILKEASHSFPSSSMEFRLCRWALEGRDILLMAPEVHTAQAGKGWALVAGPRTAVRCSRGGRGCTHWSQ